MFLASPLTGPLARTFHLQAHNQGAVITIATDACPWGMGAILVVNGVIMAYFAIRIARQDELILRTPAASADGQQVWEALTTLIALRVWAPIWRHRRVRLRMRTDNMTAIALVQHLKGKGFALSSIAREMALDIASSEYEPDVVEHLPGVMNVVPDKLSRKYEPGKHFTLPEVLSQAKEVHPPERSLSWWRAYSSRTAPPSA